MKRKSVESLNAFFVLFLRQRGGTACRAVPRRERSGGARCGTDRCRRRCSDRAGGPVAVGYRSRCIPFRSEGAYPEAPAGGRKNKPDGLSACFGVLCGVPVFGAGRWRRCGCETDLRRLFPDLLCYLFRYLSRYIFSSRGMTGLVMNPLHPASSAVRRSVSKA